MRGGVATGAWRRVMCGPLLALLLLLAPCARGETPVVVKLSLHDTVQPVTAGYLKRGLERAAEMHAAAVLISLGTPGGLLDSTREMVSAMEASPVPVMVYVEPAGSRAGSAGFFLLEAADVAAMAPGTNAGAAHPVLEGQTMDPVLKEKLENDAAAFLRSYVTAHGRNAAAAEDAVRNSKSYSDEEALRAKLIDVVARDEGALFHATPGLMIHRFNGTQIHLDLSGARVVSLPPSMRERLLTRLTSPDLDVLLLVCGALLIYLEVHVPGTVAPGALGTLLLLLGLFGLNLLPVRHTAILLLIAAAVLMALEAKFASHGALAVTGMACLIFGLATLVDSPAPEMRVHVGTAVAAGVGFGGISFFLAWIALKARRNKRLLGPQAMIGRLARALTDLAPAGQVEVRGEIWYAIALAAGTIPAGAEVIVDSVEGLTLRVSRAG